MRYRDSAPLVLVCLSLLLLPSFAFSEVKVSLKNGREIIADRCKAVKDRLICEKMGGSFEFDQKDILDVKVITIQRDNAQENSAQEPASVTEGQEEAIKSAEESKNGAKSEEGVLIRGANPEQGKRLDQINQRKLELKGEREKLSKEREQLHQEVKETGMVYTQEKLDQITKRISDIEEKISRFNEEVKKLNAEESSIIEGLNKGK